MRSPPSVQRYRVKEIIMTDRQKEPLNNLSLRIIKPEDLIAPNFKFYELTKSELSSRLRIANTFPGDV